MAFTIHNPTLNFASSTSTTSNEILGSSCQSSASSSTSLTLSSTSSSSRTRKQKPRLHLTQHKYQQAIDMNRLNENEKFLYQYQNKVNKIYADRTRQSKQLVKKSSDILINTQSTIRNKRNYATKSGENSSEISSTIQTSQSSELDTNSTNTSNSQCRLQRKKFIKCILREDVHLIKNLLSQHDLTMIRDKHQNTLLHIACGFGRVKSVQALIKICPRLVDFKDDRGHTPVDIAIKHGQIEVCKLLINRKNNSLSFACRSENSSILDPNERSCLHFAAKHGENEILRHILSEMYQLNLSVDLRDSNGNTAAHLAAKYNHLDCLQTLVEFNCDITIVNKNGHTPCFLAEYHRHQECVHYLMIVETCISLSIKVVKIGRKLRETRSSNEVLKAQMDEVSLKIRDGLLKITIFKVFLLLIFKAIAINNDFINQRENYMNISLDLMKKQINELGEKLVNEIDKLQAENKSLRQSLRVEQSKNTENKKSLNVYQNEDYCCLDELIKKNINCCEKELLNTKKNCNRVLRLDQKKMENIKSRFNEIKINIEASNEAGKCSDGQSCESTAKDIIESREHFEVLRKIYQETTHKLMIFRNALKERNINTRPPVPTKISPVAVSSRQIVEKKRPRGLFENRLTSTSLSNDQVSVENENLKVGRQVTYINENENLDYSSDEEQDQEEYRSESEDFENHYVLNYDYDQDAEEDVNEFTDDVEEKNFYINEQWYVFDLSVI